MKKQRRRKRKNIKKNNRRNDNIGTIIKETKEQEQEQEENENEINNNNNNDNDIEESTKIKLKSDLEKLLDKKNITPISNCTKITIFQKKSLFNLDSNLQRKYMYGLTSLIINNKEYFERFYLDVFKTIQKCSEFNIIFFTHFLNENDNEEKYKKFLLHELSNIESISNETLYLYQSYFDSKYLKDLTPLLSHLSSTIKKEKFSEFLFEYIEKPKMKLNLLKEIIRLIGKLEPEKSELIYYKLWKRKDLHKDVRLTILESKLKYLIKSPETWRFFKKIINIKEKGFLSIRNWFINHSPSCFNFRYFNNWVNCLLRLLTVIENDTKNKNDEIILNTLLSIQDFLPFLTDKKLLALIIQKIKIYINSSIYIKSSKIAIQIILSSLQVHNMWETSSDLLLSIIKDLLTLSFKDNALVNQDVLFKVQSIIQGLSLIEIHENYHQRFFDFIKQFQNSTGLNDQIMEYIYPQYIFMVANFSKFDQQLLEKSLVDISTLIEKLKLSSSLELLVEQVSQITPVCNWLDNMPGLIDWFNRLLQSKHIFIRYYLLLLVNQFTHYYGWGVPSIIKILQTLRHDKCNSLKYLAVNTTPYNEVSGKRK